MVESNCIPIEGKEKGKRQIFKEMYKKKDTHTLTSRYKRNSFTRHFHKHLGREMYEENQT